MRPIHVSVNIGPTLAQRTANVSDVGPTAIQRWGVVCGDFFQVPRRYDVVQDHKVLWVTLHSVLQMISCGNKARRPPCHRPLMALTCPTPYASHTRHWINVSLVHGGPTLNQHCFNVLCLLGTGRGIYVVPTFSDVWTSHRSRLTLAKLKYFCINHGDPRGYYYDHYKYEILSW